MTDKQTESTVNQPQEIPIKTGEKKAFLISIIVIILMPIVAFKISDFLQRNTKREVLGIINVWDRAEPYKVFKVGQYSRVKDRTTNIYFEAQQDISTQRAAKCYTLKMIASYDKTSPIEKKIGYNLIKASNITKDECLSPKTEKEIQRKSV